MANIDPTPSWADIRRLETTDRNMAGPGGILNDPTTSIAARLNLLRDNDTILGNSVAAVNARQDATDTAIADIQGQVLNAPGTLSDLESGPALDPVAGFPDVPSVENTLGPVNAINESIESLAARSKKLLEDLSEFSTTGGADLVGSSWGTLAQVSARVQRTIYIDQFDEGSDTANLQAAIDAAAALTASNPGVYPTVVVPRREQTYVLTNVVISEDLVLDFDGSKIEFRPSIPAGGDGSPCISIKGERSADSFPITPTVARQAYVDAGSAATNFAVGDFVILSDAQVVYKYTEPTVVAYTGRRELNQVVAITGSQVFLAKNVDRAYTVTPQIQKLTKTPRVTVKNVAYAYEVDPGAPYSGSTLDAPHFIQAHYAFRPQITDVYVDRFQLMVAHCVLCVEPTVERVVAKNAFRPSEGGHGYLSRVNSCMGAFVGACLAYRVRHLVDDTQSADTVSQLNRAYDMVAAGYLTHGFDSKRFTSIDDAYYGGEVGWNQGNASFASDDGMRLVRPKCRAANTGIRSWCGSNALEVFDPDVVANHFGIAILRSSTNAKVVGGVVDMRGAQNQVYNSDGLCLLARAEFNVGTEAYASRPVNVSFDGVRVFTPAFSRASAVRMDALGDLVCRSTFAGDNISTAAFDLCPTAASTSLTVSVTTSGTIARSVVVGVAPTGYYSVRDCKLRATHSSPATNVALSNRLIFQGNEKGSGSWSWQSATTAQVIAAVIAGAQIDGNSPEVTGAGVAAGGNMLRSDGAVTLIGTFSAPLRFSGGGRLWYDATAGAQTFRVKYGADPISATDGMALATSP